MLGKFKRLKEKVIKKRADPLDAEFDLVYPMINTVEGFLKSPKQERWFYGAARTAPKDAVIVEIGSFKGRSTVSFGFGCVGTQRHIYAIDLFEGDGASYGQGDFQKIFQENVDRCGLTSCITAIKKHSLKVAATWDQPIDILFIDGSHEYEDVKADFEAFYKFVKPGGIIAFHDIKGIWVGVIRFWGELKDKKILKNFNTVSSLGYGTKY